jgi:hypothetical protein
MMILSAVRSISHDIPGIYPSMVDQTNRQRQTKPHHSPWLKSEYHGHIYNENTSGGSKPNSAKKSSLSKVTVPETDGTWTQIIDSEYHGHRYNEKTDGSSVSEEKWHHSR